MELKHMVNLGQSHLRRLGELIEPELYTDYYDVDSIANDFTQMPAIEGSASCKKRDKGEPVVTDLSQIRHFLRYKFLSLLAYNKNVLDCACGCGYGSYIIGRVAKKVIGIDLDHNAIAFANKYHKTNNVSFIVSDVENLKKCIFDLIVSIEIFEHIMPKKIDSFLSSLKSMINDDGIIAFTTPLFKQTLFHPVDSDFVNLHSHYAEYSRVDFIKALTRNGLKIEQYVLQKFDGSILYNIPKNIKFSKNMGDIRHWVQIAICRKIN